MLTVPGTAQGGWMPGKSRNGRVDVLRLAAVGLLLIVVAIGVRARTGISAKRPRLSAASFNDFLNAVGVAEVIAAVASVVVLVLVFGNSRQERGGRMLRRPRSRLARTVAVLLVLALLAIEVVLFRFHAFRKHRSAAPHPSGSPLPATHHPAHAATSHAQWPLAVMVAAAVVLAVTLVLAQSLRRYRSGEPDLDETPDAPSTAPLHDALAAAADAVGDPGDPRRAIIASYAAMEARLAEAGAAPAAADTPAEVLARAADSGLVRSHAADTLTGLFRRARYSRHRLGETDRAAARRALARLRTDLKDRQ